MRHIDGVIIERSSREVLFILPAESWTLWKPFSRLAVVVTVVVVSVVAEEYLCRKSLE